MMWAIVIDLWQRTGWDELVVGGAAVATGITVIWRTVVRPSVGAFRQGAKAWQWIEDELSPNGGDSLRDRIDQHTAALAEVAEKLRQIGEVLGVVPTLAEQVSQMEAELRALKDKESLS